MRRTWTPLAIVYLIVAIVGLATTWSFNAIAIATNSTWFGEWFSNPPATQSLQVDLLVLAVTCGILIVVEGRRIGMRRSWLFLPLSAITAAAFAVPLFLALRERHLSAQREPANAARGTSPAD